MKRLMLILPAATLLLSGCAVYDAGPAYQGRYYAPAPAYSAPYYPAPGYGYPRYVAPPVYGGVWFGGGGGRHGRWR